LKLSANCRAAPGRACFLVFATKRAGRHENHYLCGATMKTRDLGFWLSRLVGYPFVSPDVVQIPLTNRCNLKCRMCSIPQGKKGELSREEIFDLIKQAGAWGIREAILTGGEPFLREDLFEICDYSRSQGIRSVVTTNGTAITSEMARQAVSCGLGHLHFSLDGLEESHDLMRGKGSFRKSIEAIKLFEGLRRRQDRGPSLGVACTVMDHNLEDLPGLLEYADSLGVDVINFQPLLKDNTNTPDRGSMDLWVARERWGVLDDMIEKIKNFPRKHIHIYEEPDLRLLKKYYRQSLAPSDWICFGGYKTAFICLTDDGAPAVYTCHGLCGSLKNKKLKACWLSAEARLLRKRVKTCRKPCLQACYSRVSSESPLKKRKGN
jgi:MoaA/NifB/PqqE/SkfB family radical SAM enzyme